jgi:hypothetical protein
MDDNVFRKQVNASGYPFQLRVHHEVKTSYGKDHNWFPICQEHRWQNSLSGTEGFIDLVLLRSIHEYLSLYIVVECKRVSGGCWVFLNPRSDHQQRSTDHALVTKRQQNKSLSPIWEKIHFEPVSSTSSFCTVPGQGNKDTPMLERVSGELLDSLESIATEQLNVGQQPSQVSQTLTAIYLPVIVTNTQLVVCQFQPSEVDLSEGKLTDDRGEFESVPFIRFQKNFTTRYTTATVPMSLAETNRENEKTIFVVHAPRLRDFLRQCNLD